MIRSVKDLIGYEIHAIDGLIGHVDDFYFDDDQWSIRYLIVDTGSWLPGKKVLISPKGLDGSPDWNMRLFPLKLTRQKIKSSPDIVTDKPVSRQFEEKVLEHYQWPVYWNINLGGLPVPGSTPAPKSIRNKHDEQNDIHLRSCKEILHYKVHAKTDECGYVNDFFVNDENWKLAYLRLNFHKYILGKYALIPIEWVRAFDWDGGIVHSDLNKEQIQNSPDFKNKKILDSDEIERIKVYFNQLASSVAFR